MTLQFTFERCRPCAPLSSVRFLCHVTPSAKVALVARRSVRANSCLHQGDSGCGVHGSGKSRTHFGCRAANGSRVAVALGVASLGGVRGVGREVYRALAPVRRGDTSGTSVAPLARFGLLPRAISGLAASGAPPFADPGIHDKNCAVGQPRDGFLPDPTMPSGKIACKYRLSEPWLKYGKKLTRQDAFEQDT